MPSPGSGAHKARGQGEKPTANVASTTTGNATLDGVLRPLPWARARRQGVRNDGPAAPVRGGRAGAFWVPPENRVRTGGITDARGLSDGCAVR